MDYTTLFDKLLHAEDEQEVDALLKRIGYGLDEESVWRPLGGMENNFSTVGNQQTEATAAMVEKIINGIDATLMAECFKHDIDPEGAKAPATMAEAVERFFGIRGGQLADMDAKSQTALATNLQVVAVGEKSKPCYLIVDKGEGQTPAAFPDTFLSLNRSNKLRIPFVQGKFNSGGTGVLQFCGEHNMQLIVSRRHPQAPTRPGDSTRELWGFTIVRRMKPTAGRRNSMYVYLAPNGEVPRFAADEIKVLPDDRRSVAPRPYVVGLPYGTCVKLYNFRWKARSIATTEARYELERFLHSPCLPFRLTETREYRANYFSTTISGVWANIEEDAADGKSKKVEPGFPAFSDLNLQGVGNLPYRITVFRDSVDGRHVPHGVFFTVNGQVHGGLPADFVARSLKFDYLRDHLLVSVDCTAMDATVREDFFLASRDRVRKNDVYEELVDDLKDKLRDHPGLRELNAARRKKVIEEAISDEKEAEKLFDALLKADPMLATLFGTGDRLVTTTGPGPSTPFVGRKFPSYFRLAKDPAGGMVKNCPVNQKCRVEFETDAANDYFKRLDCPGSIVTTPANVIEHSSLWNGKFVAHMRVPWDAKPGDRIEVTVVVEDVETQSRGQPFISKLVLVADAEAEKKPSGSNGGGEKRKPNQTTTHKVPALAVPEIQEMKMGNPNTSLEVRHDDAGGYEFFVNLENTYLLTEMTRAKTDEDRLLVKYWFKYGLALCAMGMLHDEKQRTAEANAKDKEPKKGKGKYERDEEFAETPEEDDHGDLLKRVNTACNGLARVMVPIIRVLYRGPQAVVPS